MKTNKLPFLVLCLLLVIPFYLTFIVFFQTSKPGDQVADISQTIKVHIADGQIQPASHIVEFDVPDDDSYSSSVTLDAGEPGILTGFVIKSPAGEKLTVLTSYGLNDLPCNITTQAGTQTVEIFFFSSREDLADFMKAYYDYTDGPILETYLDQYDFSVVDAAAEREVNFRMTVTELVGYPISNQLIALIIGFVLLALLFTCLTPEKEENVTLKERLSGVGNCYGIFAIAVMFTQVLVIFFLRNFLLEFTSQNAVFLSLALTILAVDVVGFPLTFLACKKIPATPIEQKSLGFGKFILFVLMSAGLVGAGGVIGSIVHNTITAPFGNPDSALSMLMMNSGMFMRVLTVGICAPIFEELVFRKLLVDRLIKYGEFITIITSGLFFGLFHGNFQQFFFAFALGCLWAFVYARTGRIRYTIGMHMAINMSTSVITVFLTGKVAEYPELMNVSDINTIMSLMETQPEAVKYIVLYGLWLIALVLIAIIGLILLIVNLAQKKFRLRVAEGEATKGQALAALFSNGFVWIFLLATFGLFLNSYLPYFLAG